MKSRRIYDEPSQWVEILRQEVTGAGLLRVILYEGFPGLPDSRFSSRHLVLESALTRPGNSTLAEEVLFVGGTLCLLGVDRPFEPTLVVLASVAVKSGESFDVAARSLTSGSHTISAKAYDNAGDDLVRY